MESQVTVLSQEQTRNHRNPKLCQIYFCFLPPLPLNKILLIHPFPHQMLPLCCPADRKVRIFYLFSSACLRWEQSYYLLLPVPQAKQSSGSRYLNMEVIRTPQNQGPHRQGSLLQPQPAVDTVKRVRKQGMKESSFYGHITIASSAIGTS